jgi:hypothetical protein
MGSIATLPWKSPLKDSARRLAAVAGRLSALRSNRVYFLQPSQCMMCGSVYDAKLANWSLEEYMALAGDKASHGLCSRPKCHAALMG